MVKLRTRPARQVSASFSIADGERIERAARKAFTRGTADLRFRSSLGAHLNLSLAAEQDSALRSVDKYRSSVILSGGGALWSGGTELNVTASWNRFPAVGSPANGGVRLSPPIGDVTFAPPSTASLVTTLYDASIRQKLPWGQSLFFRVRTVGTPLLTEGSRTAALIEVRQPLHVFTGAPKGTGRVEVILRERVTGLPVKGAVIQLGSWQVLTDTRGRAAFANVPFGTYQFAVVKGSLGPVRVTTHDEHSELTVASAATTRIKVAASAPGILSGSVIRYEPPRRLRLADTVLTEPVPAGGVSGITVTIEQDGVVYTTVTDHAGAFRFSKLYPGSWLLRVAGGVIPERHVLVDHNADIDVPAGSTAQVELRVLPVRYTPGG